jgi:hypothetical protein
MTGSRRSSSSLGVTPDWNCDCHTLHACQGMQGEVLRGVWINFTLSFVLSHQRRGTAQWRCRRELPAGGLGVSPNSPSLPPRMGDQRGLISNVDTLAAGFVSLYPPYGLSKTGATTEGLPLQEVQRDAAGGLGVSPRYSLLPPRMGVRGLNTV